MPPVEGSMYCIYMLNKIGTYKVESFGLVPLAWSDIESYANSTGIELNGWEVETIRHLSQVFVNAFVAASEPLKAPEHSEKETPISVAQRLRAKMSLFKNRSK